jgi:hypothetical protein
MIHKTIFHTFFALFLIAHAFIHISLTWVPTPQPGSLQTPFLPTLQHSNIDPGWWINRTGWSSSAIRGIGWYLCLAATILYLLSGLGFFGIPGLQSLARPIIIGASVLSLALLTLFGHPWYGVGLAIDIALLIGAAFSWPIALFAL